MLLLFLWQKHGLVTLFGRNRRVVFRHNIKRYKLLEESLPVYKDWDVRQITIKRLYKFLHESVNLEPELEQFIRTLIFLWSILDKKPPLTYFHPATNAKSNINFPFSSYRISRIYPGIKFLKVFQFWRS